MTRPRPSLLALVTVGHVAAFTAFAVARGDRRIVAYLVVWSLLAGLVHGANRRYPLPRPVLWALVAAGALHLAGGLIPSPQDGSPILYETWLIPSVLKVDQAFHAVICAVVTIALDRVLAHVIDPTRGGPVLRATVAMLGCWGFGAANELFEFLSALRFHDAFVGDLGNAGWDLVFNTVGSLAAAVWLVLTTPNWGQSFTHSRDVLPPERVVGQGR